MPGHSKPTTADADLLIKLLKMGDNPQMTEAMTWFDKELNVKSYAEFEEKFPDGSKGSQYFGRIMGGYELAGALISQGILNENLYFDVSPIGFMWEKLGPIAQGARKKMKSPALWENAVWLAERQKKWSKTVWKPNFAWKSRR